MPTTHITLSEAASRASITYRAARRLAARGTFKAKPADGHEDGRVRLVVTVRSVNAYIRRRPRKPRR
jgi:hypothetical protein